MVGVRSSAFTGIFPNDGGGECDQPLFFLNSIFLSDVQEANAEGPIFFSVDGRVSDGSDVHDENASASISVSPSESVRDLSDVQPENAPAFMLHFHPSQ